jgi:hypothetical protein
MFGLRQTVSLLLFGLGALFVLLGSVSWFIETPEGVSLESVRWMQSAFAICGALGLALIAWGIYLRSSKAGAAGWPLWVAYLALLGPLIGLGVFVGDEVLEMIGENWERSSLRERRGILKGIIGLVFIFFGPIILLFRGKSPSKGRHGNEP